MMNAKRSSRFTLTRYAFVVPAVVALLLVFTFSKASVTKPISLKINSVVKPVTLTITEAIKPLTAAIKKAANKMNISTDIKTDTVPDKVKITADIKVEPDSVVRANHTVRGVVNIRTKNAFNVNSIDSANFVVNGIKTKPSDFKNVNPQDIEAINIVSADALDDLLGPDRNLRFDNNQKVVFVTTKNSEAGQKLLKKLGNKRQLTNIRITKDGPAQNINGTDIAILGKGGSQGTASAITGTGVASNGSNLNAVVVTGYESLKRFHTDSATSLHFKNNVFDGRVPGAVYLENPTLNSEVKLFDNVGIAKVEYFERPSLTNKLTGRIYTTSSTTNGVNRISDKLIIIDGKEATEKELKKISAFDIDRMNVSSDSDTIKKYGDKAKYGVVYIYTKKGK
jgi:bla regulator protein BlaR1